MGSDPKNGHRERALGLDENSVSFECKIEGNPTGWRPSGHLSSKSKVISPDSRHIPPLTADRY